MIGLIGLNHKSAPIEVREKFVFCEEDIKRFVPLLQSQGIQGAVVLSTCNRTEIYFELNETQSTAGVDLAEKILLNYRNAEAKVARHFYRKTNEELVHHLFCVVSGLDSMALGEYQIVGQIKDAYTISEKYNFASPVLNRLFNKAFKAGKKVRTDTALNKGAVSISYAGVELAGKKLHNLTSHPVLLVGAGQTGELTLLNLIKKGCDKFTITNRTYQKACELAEKYKCKAEEFTELENLLLQNDIIITSTASKKPLFNAEMVQKAMQERNNKPLFFLDLSVPRNVAVEVGNVENVYVYDIDALNGVVESNLGKRRAEISQAEEIIGASVSEFVNWLNTRKLIPTFQTISNSFLDINKTELNIFLKKRKESGCEKASEYGEVITNKLIRLMIENVKTITDNGRRKEYLHVVNELFNQN